MDYGQHAYQKKPSVFRTVFGILLMVAVVVGIAWAVRTYVLEPFEIPSASMEHTINIGDRVFAEKVTYLNGSPAQGDIVVFEDPQDKDEPYRMLIKRVIATGGQTVDLIDGKVYVDGQQIDEPYTEGSESVALIPAGNVFINYPYTVPQGYVWVMGDNRENSADSRYFGPIPESSVVARAFLTYWPFDRFGLLDS